MNQPLATTLMNSVYKFVCVILCMLCVLDVLNASTIESRDYVPPFVVDASIGQKWGGGLIVGSLLFCVMTITVMFCDYLCFLVSFPVVVFCISI